MLWMPGFFEKLGMNGVASPIIGMMNKILNYLPFNVIELDVLTNIGKAIIGYLPYAVSGILMLGLAILLANYVQKIILKSFPESKATALLVKVLIIILGVFITLYQLGIASQLVNTAFLIILGAFGVAFAVTFGLGGREFASHMLNKVENKIDEKSKK